MINRIFVVLALIIPLSAMAEPGQRTLTWDAPTARQDGTALSLEAISHYTLTCETGAEIEIPAESPEGRHTVSRDDIMPGGGYGETPCVMTVTDIDGNVSEASNEATVWFHSPPSAPTNLLVIE